MKKLLIFSAFMISLVTLSVPAIAGTKFINVGTGSTGGTFYPVGVILATTFNSELAKDGYKFTAQSSGGSAENLEMIREKELKLAIAGSVLVSNAYQGLDRYKGQKIENVRFVTALWPEAIQLMYRVGSGIKSLKDFRGKRIAVGPAAGGGVFYLPSILKGVDNMSFDDFKPQYLGLGDSAQALQNRLIDACYLAAGLPTSAVSQLYAGQLEVGMIEYTDAEVAAVQEVAPYFARIIIPNGTYPNQTRDLNSIGIKSSLVTEKEVDATVVYRMLEGLYIKNLAKVQSQHGVLKSLSVETAIQGLSGAPLHPGAVKFYREHGVKVPSALIPPEMK